MKKTILLSLSLLALVALPALAAETPAVPGGCDLDLNALLEAPVTPAVDPAELSPLAGVVEVQDGCCAGQLAACQARCECGVFEFNCSPNPCQSNCICNICG